MLAQNHAKINISPRNLMTDTQEEIKARFARIEANCRQCGIPLKCATLCDACAVNYSPFIGEPIRWEDVCPNEYLDTNPEDPRIAGLWNRVTEIDTHNSGIGIIGARGSGKTRCLIHLARKRYPRVLPAIVNHVELGKAATDATGGSTRETRTDAQHKLARWARCWILILDDVGKAASTERSTETLYAIVEERTSQQRQIWWSSELGANDLQSKLGERGPAILRRLAEFSTIISA